MPIMKLSSTYCLHRLCNCCPSYGNGRTTSIFCCGFSHGPKLWKDRVKFRNWLCWGLHM